MRELIAEKRLAAEVNLMLAARRMKDYVKNLMKSEEGDTNFVAIIIIIVILIAIAAIFHEQLAQAIEKVFGSLGEFIDGNEGKTLRTE